LHYAFNRRMKSRRAKVVCIALVLVLILIAGWWVGENLAPMPEEEPKTITIIDMRNKTVAIPTPVNRIVTVPLPHPAIFYAVGGSGKQIVGMNPQSMSAVQESILGVMAPELLNASTSFVTTGFEVNIEELVKLKPDVVIQWARTAAEIKDCEKIEAVGIPVIGIKYGTQKELDSIITIMGQLLGAEDKASELIAYHHAVIDEVSAITKDIPVEKKPKVLYIYSDLRVAGNDLYNDFWIETTGGINVADSLNGWVTVNMEQVLAWNPDIVYIGNFNNLQPEDFLENKISGQDWSQVEAVKKGQVYKVPLGAYRWDPPNAESPLMFKWLAEKQHPDLFNYDIRQEIRDFFSRFYGYAVSDEEIEKILNPAFTGTGVPKP